MSAETDLIGRMAEKMVFDAISYVDKRVEGILAWRMGNAIEDQRGIDIVVYTMWGKMPIQVKSSLCGMKNFWSKQKKGSRIKVIIAKDPSEARRNALMVIKKELEFLRRRYGPGLESPDGTVHPVQVRHRRPGKAPERCPPGARREAGDRAP